MDTTFSKHAARRMQQRGIPMAVIDLLLAECDRCTPVGGGCTLLSLSRKAADGLRGDYSNQLIDAAKRTRLICNDSGGLVTVEKIHTGKRRTH